MTDSTLEQRVAVLEEEVARLKNAGPTEQQPWWKEWVGAFRGDPYFKKAMKYGRQYRESLRPKRPKKRKPKK